MGWESAGARPEGANQTSSDNRPPLLTFSLRNANSRRLHGELCVFHVTQIILFSPNSKTCLRLFVLEKPEGMETFAGTVRSNSSRRDFPDSLPPAGKAGGPVVVGTQPLSVFFLQRTRELAGKATLGRSHCLTRIPVT